MAKNKKPVPSLSHALSEAARKHGDRVALIGPKLQLTHAELDACVARAAAALIKQGIKPGGIVGVSMATSPLHLVTLLALGRAGAGTVHLHPGLPPAVKNAIAKQFDISAVVSDADPAWLEPGKAPGDAIQAKPDSPWRVALSSGTTGLQKAILSRHAQLLAYLALHAHAVPVEGDDRFLCHRGLDAQLALNPALRHLLAGAAVVFPESLKLEHFIEAVDRHQVTQTTMSPAYLRDLLSLLPPGGVRFPTIRKLQVSGSTMPPPLLEAGMARVTPNLFATYGTSELGLLAIAYPEVLRRAPLSVGKVPPWLEAEAVDGVLRFRRPGMPTEYYRNPEATAKAFRDGWFYPGDIGRIDADGLLYIEGRVDDKLNLDGVKIEPGPIERALQEHPSVVEAAAFGAAPDGNRSALFAAAVLRAPVDESVLITHCRNQVGPMHTPVRIFFVKELPRNEGGKLVRAELARRVARKPQT